MKAGSQGSEGRCLLGSQVIFDQATWQIELRRSTAGELNQADKLAGSLAYCFPSHASVESTDKRVVFDHIAHRTARERASRLDGGLFGQPWYDACMRHQCHSCSWFHQWLGRTLWRVSYGPCLIAIALLSFPLLAIAQSPQMPQPALLPPTSPLCDSSLVPCLSIDDLAAHGQVQVLILPRTAERSTAITIPYGISMGLFGRISISVSSSTSFWSQSDERLQSQGPLRLSMTALLWPLFPLRTDPQTSSFRLGIAYDHELRVGPFAGANSLGIGGDLSVVRVVGQKSLGPFVLTLSVGALVDPLRQYATGEAAAQLAFQLPFLRSLKLSVDALARGAPSYVHPESVATLGSSPIPIQAALALGISYQPHSRVDFGVSVTRAVGGIAPWSVLVRFVTISVGKTYHGSAATPLTELGADLAALGAEKVKEGIEALLKETFEESPIDPKLDASCLIRDDDGSIMGRFGNRTPDGRFCEKDGVKVPIGKELWRDRSGDRLCNESRWNPRTREKELYDCVMWRRQKEWLPAHQARLNDRCELRDDDGRLLAQVGQISSDRHHCRYPVTRDNGKYGRYTEYQERPLDKIYYTDQERSQACETPNLKRCFLATAEGRGTLKMEDEERFARGADRAVTDRERSLKETGQRIEDVASGKVSVTTIKDEVTEKTTQLAETVTDPDKLKAFAKDKITGWLTGIDAWSHKRPDDQLDDAGAFAADAVIDGAVGLGTGALGQVAGAAQDAASLTKAERKAARAARRIDRDVELDPHPTGPYGHLPAPRTVAPGKPPTAAQKRQIRAENMKANSGKLVDDYTGEELVPPVKSTKGISPPPNEAQIDHRVPASAGGDNSYENLRLTGRKYNRSKSDRMPHADEK